MKTPSINGLNKIYPIIGITPLVDEERDSYWMLPGYMNGIRAAGGVPVMLPLSSDKEELSQILHICHGLLFTGGQDVEPSVYGETIQAENVVCCPKRDAMELLLLDLALKRDISVLGICRGIQLFNAALGGTLCQDIPTQHPSETIHSQKPPYHLPAHDIKILRESPLFDLIGKDQIGVTSYHHQAVKDLAPALRCMAVSDDGLVEAVVKPDQHFFWAVQWHPEFSYVTDENSRKIFKSFVTACCQQ